METIKNSEVINLLGCSQKKLEEFFVSINEKPFRAVQVMKWIHQRGVSDFSQMTDLSKDLRLKLEKNCIVSAPEVIYEKTSEDGTRKWVISVGNKDLIEMVLIPEKNRATLCVSSQVGCAVDCSFCATGKQGFSRNLNLDEIIGQVWVAANSFGVPRSPDARPITNVVMMGMGEPLLNFEPVVDAMKLMMDDNAYGLSKRKVTLSTSGIVPNLEALGDDCNVSLAVSLPASNDELRNKLVPINKIHPINDLLDVCWAYAKKQSNRYVTFEYVMLEGINDSAEQAKELIKLIKDVPSKLNLIPFNPFPKSGYNCSKRTVIKSFQEILIDAGIVTTIRKTRGDDIDAACGQLAGQVQDKTKRTQRLQLI